MNTFLAFPFLKKSYWYASFVRYLVRSICFVPSFYKCRALLRSDRRPSFCYLSYVLTRSVIFHSVFYFLLLVDHFYAVVFFCGFIRDYCSLFLFFSSFVVSVRSFVGSLRSVVRLLVRFVRLCGRSIVRAVVRSFGRSLARSTGAGAAGARAFLENRRCSPGGGGTSGGREAGRQRGRH